MKKFIFVMLVSFILPTMYVKAQDVIVKTDKSTILSKVEEVAAESIRYRRWDNLEGPIYVLNISDIISINYSNGIVEVFNDNESSNIKNNHSEKDNVNIIATPAEDNEEAKAQYSELPKLNIKIGSKKSKKFFPIMAFTDESVISSNEVTVVIQPEAVEFYDGGWKVKIGYLITIVNKADTPIYVDRANSFRIFNDRTSKSYWDNKQVSVTHGNKVSVGIPGVASSSASSHSENHGIDRFVSIAPHSYANLVDYKYIRLSETKAEFKTISDIEYWGFDFMSDPTINVGEVRTYSEADSPYSNKYYIVYSTDSEFKTTYSLQFELYAKWVVGSDLTVDTWSNLSPTNRIVKEIQKVVPDFWTGSMAIIGIPGEYL